jgi:hypothetical protein
MSVGKGLAITAAFVCALCAVDTAPVFAYFMGFGGLIVACL